MDDRRLNFVLVGKTGNGISSTGNTIFGRQVFKTSAGLESLTETVSGMYGVIEGQEILVVDCPGLDSTHNTNSEDIKATRRNREVALRICNNCITSFLLIITCEYYSLEDRMVVDRLRYVYGDEFFNHVIIVITRGDEFYDVSDKEFRMWCRQQTGPLADLFQACTYRIVLFNNTDRDEDINSAQIKYLLKFAKQVPPYTGVGTPDCGKSDISASVTSLVQVADKDKEDQEKTRLHYLLIGKTGHGKSSTGNLLLGSKVFESKASATAVTSEVTCHYTEYENYIFKVVDTPGLMDTRFTPEEDKRQAIRNMITAVSMCSEGVDAFLYVHPFNTRFTHEEINTLSTLKEIFGESYMSYVIVILTHGDNFENAMKHDGEMKTFKEWCEEQQSELKQLYLDCGKRFVLINNYETDEKRKTEQRDQVYKYLIEIKMKTGRYTSKCFEMAAVERGKVSTDDPILIEEIQETLGLLTSQIENVSIDITTLEADKILTCIRKAECALDKYGSTHFSDIRDDIDTMKQKIREKNIAGLKLTQKKVENIRKAASIWDKLSPALQVLSFIFAFIPGCQIPSFVGKGVTTLGDIVFGGLKSYATDEEAKIMTDNETTVGNHRPLHIKHRRDRKTICLIGKVDAGKTAVLNTICGKEVFKERSFFCSGTKEIDFSYKDDESKELIIVDTPGWDFKNVKGVKKAMVDIDTLLSVCSTGVHCFLYVLKYTKMSVPGSIVNTDTLTKLFGEDFYKRMIIIITRGDDFCSHYKTKGSGASINEYCCSHNDELRQLWHACRGRVVLVNNRERDEESQKTLNQILRLVDSMNTPYTSADFKAVTDKTGNELLLDNLEGELRKKELRFLMVGSTGAGKSATANFLVQEDLFVTSSSNAKSETKDVKSYNAKFKNYEILVVDGPGFNDTDITIDGMGVVQVNEALKIAMTKCCGGVDAFLMVIKVIDRYTSKQKLVIDSLSKIIGSEFTKNLIVILSFGDTRPELANDADFHNWCNTQTGDFHTLYESCDGRFILINNTEKHQIYRDRKLDEILQLADKLQSSNGRYTNTNFANAEKERKRYVASCHAKLLEIKIQEQLSYLLNDIDENNMKNLRNTKIVRKMIQKFRNEVIKEDNISGALKERISKLAEVEEYLTSMSKLCKLRKKLEDIRSSRASCVEVGKKVIIGLVAPVVTLPLAGIAGAVTGFGALHYGNKESEIEKLVLEQESKTSNLKESVKKWMSPENTN